MSAPRASEIRTPSASALAAASKSAASSAARSVRRRARVCVAMSGEIVVQVRKSVQSIEGEEGGVVVVVVRWWYRSCSGSERPSRGKLRVGESAGIVGGARRYKYSKRERV